MGHMPLVTCGPLCTALWLQAWRTLARGMSKPLLVVGRCRHWAPQGPPGGRDRQQRCRRLRGHPGQGTAGALQCSTCNSALQCCGWGTGAHLRRAHPEVARAVYCRTARQYCMPRVAVSVQRVVGAQVWPGQQVVLGHVLAHGQRYGHFGRSTSGHPWAPAGGGGGAAARAGMAGRSAAQPTAVMQPHSSIGSSTGGPQPRGGGLPQGHACMGVL
jgi:hypothetical protein